MADTPTLSNNIKLAWYVASYDYALFLEFIAA